VKWRSEKTTTWKLVVGVGFGPGPPLQPKNGEILASTRENTHRDTLDMTVLMQFLDNFKARVTSPKMAII